MSLGAVVDFDEEDEGFNPLEVLVALDERLEHRQTPLARYSEYYEGEQSLVYATEKWKRAFGGLFSAFADNWCALVVDAVEERINLEGFRFGDPTGDADAWEIWQRNGMDADSELCHIDALIYGVAYAFVWYDDDDRATIDVESPEQVIVEYVPGSRRERLAGLKRWDGGDGYVYATLYMPDYLWKFKAKASGSAYHSGGATAAGWEMREEADEPWPLPNPLGVVPLVPFVNRPRILPRRFGPTEGASEIAQVIPVQDAINKTLLDMLVASEFGSFRQRWVTGMEIPVDPETGQQIEPFHSAVDRMFMAEDPAVKFGEFGQTDLGQYVRAVEMLVQHIASQTRTPPHYFYLSGTFPSGESLKAAETGPSGQGPPQNAPVGRVLGRGHAPVLPDRGRPSGQLRPGRDHLGQPRERQRSRPHRRLGQDGGRPRHPEGGHVGAGRLHAPTDRPLPAHAGRASLPRGPDRPARRASASRRPGSARPGSARPA